jgi:hypothetical protein
VFNNNSVIGYNSTDQGKTPFRHTDAVVSALVIMAVIVTVTVIMSLVLVLRWKQKKSNSTAPFYQSQEKVESGESGRPSVNKESRDLELEDTKRSNDQIQEDDLTTPKVSSPETEENADDGGAGRGDGGAGDGGVTIVDGEVASVYNDSRPAALLPTATKVAAAPGVCPKTEPWMKRPVSAFGTAVTHSSTSPCSESSEIGPTSTGETRLENKPSLHYVEVDFLDQCRGEPGGVVGSEEVEVMYAIVKVERDTTAQESDKHYDYYDL